jgi:hypothetical protein
MHFARCEETNVKRKTITEIAEVKMPISLLGRLPQWQLVMLELTVHNLETRSHGLS